MKIVVTGGAGFIGANLCRRLCADDQVSETVVLDNFATGLRENLTGVPVTIVEGSILDDGCLDEALTGAHAVVHLAARPSVPLSVEDPVSSHMMNATGTMGVLEAARRAGNLHCVVASSSSLYGKEPPLPASEDLPARPASPYAASKLATESYTLAWQATYGMSTIAYRFFNVFGPLQRADSAYAAVMPAFITRALRGEAVKMNGDGSQSRDFTYIDSVTEVLARSAIEHVSSPTPVNLAFGTRTTLLEVVEMIGESLGQPVEIDFQDPRPGDVPHSQAQNDTLRRLFPDLAAVDLKDGLAQTIDWWREQLA